MAASHHPAKRAAGLLSGLLSGLCIGLALGSASCTPHANGTWSKSPREGLPAPDLEIRPCEPGQDCQLAFTSFTGQQWSFSLSKSPPPCSVWLDSGGAWQSRPPKEPLLELWLGALPGASCPRADAEPKTHPRWMLLDRPVESAGPGGMGTTRPRFTWSRQSPKARSAIARGSVDGVLSLGRGETELLLDLERATMRSARQWLDHQVFSLVLGQNPALGKAEASLPARSHRPELWSKGREVHWALRGLRAGLKELRLVALRPGHQAEFSIPRQRVKKPRIRPRARVEPCLDCGPRRDHE